jgi:hypothetical protein
VDAEEMEITMKSFTPDNPPSCRECDNFSAGVCLLSRAQVAEHFLCLRFAARQDAPTPTPEPLHPAPPVKPISDPPSESVAVAVTEQPRVVRHRPRFSFAAWLRQIFGVNRLGTLHFPHLNCRARDEVTNTTTKGTP